uniref:Dicarbonyl and L-xylulose reductase n=1 Tax=Junco hyemalis TaxID=40217 RepID=A0A8C5J106_JUNHY
MSLVPASRCAPSTEAGKDGPARWGRPGPAPATVRPRHGAASQLPRPPGPGDRGRQRDRPRRGRGAGQGRGPRDRAEPNGGGPGEPGAGVPGHRDPVRGPGGLGGCGGGAGRGGAVRTAGEQRGRGGAAAVPAGDALGPAAIVARQMIAQGVPGAIVNVSSQASKRALRDHAVYCSTKSALDMLSKVMAMELGPHKIRVNTVNPTVVMTDMGRINWSDPQKSAAMINRIPLGKFAEVDDVVNSILFLLSDKSAMTTGSSLMIDGGFLVS